MSDRREAVRSNALYLRNVRPIDPEEIHEYVEGTPHPAVVRQLLREEAPALGLVEREDGTFVPVPDEPVSPRTGPVRRFPDRYERRLEDFLVDRYGPGWAAGASGDLLRSTIRRFKSRYLQRQSVEYDADVAAGYAIYHLPGYFAAIGYALDDLAERGLLGRSLRVLDVGAGVGGPALGLCEYLPEDALLEYHAIEPSAAADVLEALLEETERNVHPTVHRTTVEAFNPATLDGEPVDSNGTEAGDGSAASDGSSDSTIEGGEVDAAEEGFDLVLVCNVLSELDDPEAVLQSTFEWLAPDGAVLAMAPADKHTSIQLRRLERSVEGERVGGGSDRTDDRRPGDSDERVDDSGNRADDSDDRVTVYGPTVRLWPGETPDDRGWTFDVRPDLKVPGFQRRLEAEADDEDHSSGEFVNVDVQFSYSILRRDGRRRIDLDLDPGSWAKMAEMDRHVTNRIDLVAAKLSRSLSGDDGGSRGGKGRPGATTSNPLFKVSDGSESIDHYAVVTNETELNRSLLEADYGEVCTFERALVLWNDDEEAYNLVVDEETIVDRIG